MDLDELVEADDLGPEADTGFEAAEFELAPLALYWLHSLKSTAKPVLLR